jgi:hypothetical protein
MEESQQSPRSPTSHAIADNGEGETYHETRRRGDAEKRKTKSPESLTSRVILPQPGNNGPSWGPGIAEIGKASSPRRRGEKLTTD